MKKKQAQVDHAIFQAEKRYQVVLTADEVRAIANMIRNGDSKPVARSSIRVTKHIVLFRGIAFFVAYDTKRHSVATFLPKNSVELIKVRL